MADPNDKTPELELDKMLVARTERWVRENEAGERWRTAMGVTLHRRFMNDYHGYWDAQLNSYLEVPSQGLMKWPIIGPVVRTNNSNWLATRIQLEIDSTSSDPSKMGGERVAQSIFQYLYQKLWTDTEEEKMALYCQLDFNWFGVSGCSAKSSKKMMKVARLREEKVSSSDEEWSCSECGASGPATDLATTEGANLAEPQKCPACGAMGATADSPLGDSEESVEVSDGYDETPEADNFFKVLPSFLFRVDEVNGKAADLTDCQFVNMNRLSRRYQLREMYGEDLVNGLEANDGKEWLDPVKWWHRLESGSIAVEKDYKASGGNANDDDLLQESIWWTTPAAVANYKSPGDFSHPCGFKIKKGQTFGEAFKESGKEFTGLYFVLCGKKLLYICPESHNDVIIAGLWIMNGASFWGKGQQELNDIQEAANAFFSMFYEYGMHSSLPQRIYDGGMFDRKDFKNRAGGMTPTRKGFTRQHPMRWYIDTLEPGRMSGDMFALWNGIVKEGQQEIAGTPRSVTGSADSSNQTAGGQALLTQRGLSQLIPSQKSKGVALVRWCPQQLKFCQKHWTNEQIRHVLSKNDQSWEEQDVEAFRNLDVDRDLNYKVVQGTDVPVTHADKEMKLAQVVASGILWNPQVPVELRQQLARFANIDYDPDNIERERRHLTQVLKKIKAACKWAEQQGLAYIQTEQGTVLNEDTVQKILTLDGVDILPRSENLPYAKTFFANEIVAQHTAEHADKFLIAVLEARVDELIKQQVANDADSAQITGALGQAAGGGKEGVAGGQKGVSESMSYKDAPDDIRRQMEQKEGYQPSRSGVDQTTAKSAVELDHNRETDLQLQREKHAHQMEVEKMKLKAAQENEVNSKIPDRSQAA